MYSDERKEAEWWESHLSPLQRKLAIAQLYLLGISFVILVVSLSVLVDVGCGTIIPAAVLLNLYLYTQSYPELISILDFEVLFRESWKKYHVIKMKNGSENYIPWPELEYPNGPDLIHAYKDYKKGRILFDTRHKKFYEGGCEHRSYWQQNRDCDMVPLCDLTNCSCIMECRNLRCPMLDRYRYRNTSKEGDTDLVRIAMEAAEENGNLTSFR